MIEPQRSIGNGLKAKDVMTRDVVTVSPSTSLKALGRILEEHRITGAPVVDDEGRIVGLRGVMTDMTQWVALEEEKGRLVRELEELLDKVKYMSGLLAICSSCKKILDEDGNWIQLVEYLQMHSEARFTHDLCPDCAAELYPDFYNDKE